MKAVNVDDVLKILHRYGRYIFVTDEKKYSDMVDEIVNLKTLEQGPILDKIRAEIESYILSEDELSDMDEDSVKWGMKIAYDIVDKYKAESEE